MTDEAVGSAKLKKLQKIGNTRWWSKQAALETIFGPINNTKNGTYFVMLKILNDIVNLPNSMQRHLLRRRRCLKNGCNSVTF